MRIGSSLLALLISFQLNGQRLNSNLSLGGELSLNYLSNLVIHQQQHRVIVDYFVSGSFGIGLDCNFNNIGILSIIPRINYNDFKKFINIIGPPDRIKELLFETALVYRNYIYENSNNNILRDIYIVTGVYIVAPVKSQYYVGGTRKPVDFDLKLRFGGILGVGINRNINDLYFYRIDILSQLNILNNNQNNSYQQTTHIDKFSINFSIFKRI